jgi:hypothetical protein
MNKDVRRFAPRGELLERKREKVTQVHHAKGDTKMWPSTSSCQSQCFIEICCANIKIHEF